MKPWAKYFFANLVKGLKKSTNHMCENSAKPLNACSGLLNTVGFMTTTPLADVRTEGCLGTPLLLLNAVSM